MAKILIVDDDPDIVEAMRVVLENKNHRVVSALCGEEGVSKVCEDRPDLIILDVMMPTMDGFDVARILKKDEKTRKIPILMLTAVREKMGLDFRNEAGDEDWLPVDDYCEKPISFETLVAKIDKLLGAGTESS